jgi:hypothetical protein
MQGRGPYVSRGRVVIGGGEMLLRVCCMMARSLPFFLFVSMEARYCRFYVPVQAYGRGGQ